MKWVFVILAILCAPLGSHAEDCEEGLSRFMTQLAVAPSTAAVRAQIEGLQAFVDQLSHQGLMALLVPWDDRYLKGSSGHLPGLLPHRKGIPFLNLDYVEMVMVLNHVVAESIHGRLTQFTADHPGIPLPEPLFHEFQAYLVLLKLFIEERDPLPHVLTQLEKESYFLHRPVPQKIKDQLLNAYYEPLTMTEKQRLALLTSWEDHYLATQGHLPDVAAKDAQKRFLALSYQARRQVISNMIGGNYFAVETYQEAHLDQPLPEHLLDLFRVEIILRMYYKPKFNDPLPEVLAAHSTPSQMLAQIQDAQNSILTQRQDLKDRMVKQWENQKFKENRDGGQGYLPGLNPHYTGKRFAELPHKDRVNVLRNFASALQSAIQKHRQDKPAEFLLPADIIQRVQVYRLLIAQLNDWEIKQRGAQDSLQGFIAQLHPATVSTKLIRSKQYANSLPPKEKESLLSQWEDAEFSQSKHLPGLHHDEVYAGERFRSLAPQDQQTVINNLAQRIQELVTTHLEHHSDQPFDEKTIQQIFVYQILLDASRGQLPQD